MSTFSIAVRRPWAQLVAVVSAVSLCALPAITAPAAAGTGVAGCAHDVLAAPAPAHAVARNNPAALTAAAAANHRSEAALRAEARRDDTLWLDRCAKAFYVEPQSGAGASSAATAAGAVVPLADTFSLESRPGSQRTIYLDFLGGTVSGTAWQNGATISVEPYSMTAPADTAFTDAELTEIQNTWQVVAEDYAPFDVNVTTRDLGIAAIDRTSSSDLVYGSHVMITNGGPVYNGCSCGGVAYVNVFNTSGSNHMYYQPAWVFTAGVGGSGKNIGEAAAHEVGHNFGLQHDGTASVGYYAGSAPWAPIMGVGYYQPVSQWSRGEYPGANNTQDDLAVIATGAPVRTDDHGNTSAAASALANGATVDGVITSRTDVDAFRFTASGITTVTVSSPWMADLDAELRILDAAGTTVATVNPAVATVSSSAAAGLGASWSTTLPSAGAVYTAIVDGIGIGDPATAGLYSDYASIGAYRISLSTGSAPAPLTLTSSTPPAARVGTAYSAAPVVASGGTTPYQFSATGLPGGLSINPTTGAVSGTPTSSGTYPATIAVTDAAAATAGASVTFVVNPPAVTVPNQTITAVLKRAVSKQLVASGGNGTFTWTATSLPAGLSLSSSGLVTGAPTKVGTLTFKATATSAGSAGTGTITVKVTRK